MRLVKWFTLFLLTLVSVTLSAMSSVPTPEQLIRTSDLDIHKPINFDLWPKAIKQSFNPTLTGQVKLASDKNRSHLVLTEQSDSYEFELKTRANDFTNQRVLLPEIEFDFVTLNHKIIPIAQSLQFTTHPHWDYILGVGDVWRTDDQGNLFQVVMPFNLVEKNQNCVHNGILTFVINPKQSGTTASQFYYQISSETCLYYKVDMWGVGAVKQKINQKIKQKAKQAVTQNKQQELVESQLTTVLTSVQQKAVVRYVNQQQNKLPIEAISQLPIAEKNLSQLDMAKLSLTKLIKPTDMTMYGLAFNGQYYVSQCQTRAGPYPFCEELVMPSYSTAKTIFGGLSMYLLQREYPQLYHQKVSEWVPQCDLPQWQDVTFLDLLNMTTGNYDSGYPTADEAADHSQQFFAASSHDSKIKYACQQFTRKSQPGTKFVYHTSDTYLLGTALNQFVRGMKGPQTDLFKYVFGHDLWPKLRLSPVAYETRRTSDKEQQPFVGFGLFFTRDDVFKVTRYLANVAAELFNPASTDQGSLTNFASTRYDQSFWKQNIATHTDCAEPHWLPYLSGYGGISVVLVSPTIQYFYFSDSGIYDWSLAITELHTRQAICSKRTKHD
ncbi:beta-lactamase family protein [Psychrosphaera sp. B3R10]|uniref:serine hydrolase domain-containing protein n=1 Tax=unclassified Psychrosphaera TaxID=2641570 RepID=UPI001C091B07|nr:beta-lactamase family protein [Psychrosphaera sp. I2R16]MBU2987849.1 beta-lactamase family protein [Psychrosphaera sp. B3R10]